MRKIFLTTCSLLMLTPAAIAAPDWDALAECESSNTNAQTGNGYSGYYQFDDSTWASTGRSGSASDHSKAEQTAAAQDLYNARGGSPWPTCFSSKAKVSSPSPAPTPAPRPVAAVPKATVARTLAVTG